MTKTRALLAALVALTPFNAPMAHIVFDTPEARPNAYYAGALRVGHGCGDSPTTALTVTFPAGIDAARPQPKYGWTIEIEHEPLAAPVTGESGAVITDRVKAITWRGRLANEHFDEFGLSMRIPKTAGPLSFLTVQTCESGANSWTDIPAPGQAWGAMAHPAPVLNLIGATPPAAAAPAAAGEHQH
jgi:uncharacterized protein YcnI